MSEVAPEDVEALPEDAFELPLEADEADAAEQAVVVELDEDDDR